MIPATLTHYIETEIIPRHEHFDKAHNLAHVRTVIEESLALAKEYNVNESMAYTIAAYHEYRTLSGSCYTSSHLRRDSETRQNALPMVQ